MKLTELNDLEYHKELNPLLWRNEKLKKLVRYKLLLTTKSFIEFLDIPFTFDDILFTGSNVNYNFSARSDIDIHIIANYELIMSKCSDLGDNFFNTKKSLWSNTRDISIYNIPVEMYVQDSKEPLGSGGYYSIYNDTWIQKPQYLHLSYDDPTISLKSQNYIYEIENLCSDYNSDKELGEKLLTKIYNMRHDGLESGGEFSIENLVFKELRNKGLIDKLKNWIITKENKQLSLN